MAGSHPIPIPIPSPSHTCPTGYTCPTWQVAIPAKLNPPPPLLFMLQALGGSRQIGMDHLQCLFGPSSVSSARFSVDHSHGGAPTYISTIKLLLGARNGELVTSATWPSPLLHLVCLGSRRSPMSHVLGCYMHTGRAWYAMRLQGVQCLKP